jgi:hypothetical protein
MIADFGLRFRSNYGLTQFFAPLRLGVRDISFSRKAAKAQSKNLKRKELLPFSVRVYE